MTGVLKLGLNTLNGEILRKAKEARKNVRNTHPLDQSKQLLAEKNVRRAEYAQNLARGTVAAGGAAAYFANKRMKETESFIPSDY